MWARQSLDPGLVQGHAGTVVKGRSASCGLSSSRGRGTTTRNHHEILQILANLPDGSQQRAVLSWWLPT